MESGIRTDSTDDPNELFDLVNEHDRVIGTVRRGQAHSDPSLIHRSVQVLVFDRTGRLFLQRRSSHKDLFPGYLCASAAGHVAAGERYESTAQREVLEEVGVSLTVEELGRTIVRSAYETEVTVIFIARSDGPFQCHPEETDGGLFVSATELVASIVRGEMPLTPAARAAISLTLAHDAWPEASNVAAWLGTLLKE